MYYGKNTPGISGENCHLEQVNPTNGGKPVLSRTIHPQTETRLEAGIPFYNTSPTFEDAPLAMRFLENIRILHFMIPRIYHFMFVVICTSYCVP